MLRYLFRLSNELQPSAIKIIPAPASAPPVRITSADKLSARAMLLIATATVAAHSKARMVSSSRSMRER